MNLNFNREYKEKYAESTYKKNDADPEKTEKRRRREAYLEAKQLRELDEIDSDWQEMWS